MAPETRSRGVPAPSRVYHTSPALQQAQFPSRRKRIRRYETAERPSLKQQTLTQIDFVSSFEEDFVALSDSDNEVGLVEHDTAEGTKEDISADKENMSPDDTNKDEHSDGDDSPLPSKRRKRQKSKGKESKKRRRTLDDSANIPKRRQLDKSRRKTTGDAAAPPSSNYHTQTLTQFLGHHTALIADSDDDLGLGNDDEQEDGFLSWLGEPEPEPGSPSAGRGRCDFSSSSMQKKSATFSESVSREGSVIPQTPAKKKPMIRFDIDGAPQSPLGKMIERYGAPDKQDSPLHNRYSEALPRHEGAEDSPRKTASPTKKRASLVIQDSFGTEGWDTPSKSQHRGTSKSQQEHSRGSTDEPSIPAEECQSQLRKSKAQSPTRTRLADIDEIPDSDEDVESFEEDVSEVQEDLDEDFYGIGAETQMLLGEIASTNSNDFPTSRLSILPSSTPSPNRCSARQATPPAAKSPSPAQTKQIRKPIHHPSNCTQPSQPLESQRVPATILRSLPSPSARSDILLPISSIDLSSLITGHQIHVHTSFKIPAQVVRFWLLQDNALRYMASIEPESPDTLGNEYRFYVSQIYELNNPVCEDDMRQEGWVHDKITRYLYIPPAVIGQLLWNLRHAVFAEGSLEQQQQQLLHAWVDSSPINAGYEASSPTKTLCEKSPTLPQDTTPPGSMTVSQQLAAQIHSDIAQSTQFPTSDDIVPSTPDDNEHLSIRPSMMRDMAPPSFLRQAQQSLRPSQATTVSQVSTPDKTATQQLPTASNTSAIPPPPLFNTSENSIQFLDYSGSLGSITFPSSLSSTSQLLTKSQMLPDSLIADHGPPEQPEIWDSDEDNNPLQFSSPR